MSPRDLRVRGASPQAVDLRRAALARRALAQMVDDEEGGGKQEMVYDVTAEEEKGDRV